MGTGCTAVSAIVTLDKIYVGNSGDSRCIIGAQEGSSINAVAMSEDHKPDNVEEKRRIEKAGGFVEEGRGKRSVEPFSVPGRSGVQAERATARRRPDDHLRA